MVNEMSRTPVKIMSTCVVAPICHAQELLERFLKKASHILLFIEIYYPRCLHKIGADCFLYQYGKLKKVYGYHVTTLKLIRIISTNRAIRYLFHFVILFRLILKAGVKFQVFIGVNYPYPLLGLLLRKMHLVKKVVYYAWDIIPPPDQRSHILKRMLYKIMLLIDYLISKHADLVWFLSSELIGVKRKLGVPINNVPYIIVPIGVDTDRLVNIAYSSLEQQNRILIAYVGEISERTGFDVFARFLIRMAHDQTIKDNIEFLIIGQGPLFRKIRTLVVRLGLKDQVHMLGFIRDIDEIRNLLSTCSVGIALYKPTDMFSRYSDPGKVKLYIECGIPIIMSGRSPITKEIAKHGAGFIINLSEDELSRVIRYLIKNKTALTKLKRNVIKLAFRYDYRNILSRALIRSLNILFNNPYVSSTKKSR